MRISKSSIWDRDNIEQDNRKSAHTIPNRKHHSKTCGVAAVLVAALGLVTLAGCGSTGETSAQNGAQKEAQDKSQSGTEAGTTTVTIGYLPITHALAVFEEKEQLAAANSSVQIELQKFGSWTDLTDALNAGKIDGASVLIELAMNAVSQGIDLKAVGLGHRDGNVIVVSDDITSTEDLKGKTFAIPSNQSSHNILLLDMLADAGISADDLTITQLAPSEMPSSLASGAIDGYCVAEPFGAQAVVGGFGHVLYESQELWEDSLCCAFVLNNSFIEENPEAATTVINGYYDAGDSLDQEQETALASEYLGQDESVIEQSLQWISYDKLQITEEDYQTLEDKVKEYGINDNPPSYEDFVYSGK